MRDFLRDGLREWQRQTQHKQKVTDFHQSHQYTGSVSLCIAIKPHTRTHTRTQARTRSHIHTHAHTHTHTCSCVRPLYRIPPSLGGRMILQPIEAENRQTPDKQTTIQRSISSGRLLQSAHFLYYSTATISSAQLFLLSICGTAYYQHILYLS